MLRTLGYSHGDLKASCNLECDAMRIALAALRWCDVARPRFDHLIDSRSQVAGAQARRARRERGEWCSACESVSRIASRTEVERADSRRDESSGGRRRGARQASQHASVRPHYPTPTITSSQPLLSNRVALHIEAPIATTLFATRSFRLPPTRCSASLRQTIAPW